MTTLAHALDTFWLGVATHLWQSSLFVAIIALLAWLLRHSSARLIHGLYAIGVAKLLLPLPLIGRVTAGLFEFTPVSGPTWFAPRTLLDPVNVATVSPPDTAGTLALGLGLSVLWVCGLIVVLWRHARALRLAVTPAATDLVVAHDETSVLTTALGRIGLPFSAVRLSPTPGTPSVCGWLRPVVVVPRNILSDLQDDELCAVLTHEREHLRRRDPLRYAFLAALCSLFWFYPPMAWLARKLRETNEMACDESVLAAGMPVSTYRRGLARTIQLGLGLTTPAAQAGILGHHASLLHRRLERLRSARRFRAMPSHRIALAAVALLVVAASFWPLPHAGADDSVIVVKKYVPPIWNTGQSDFDVSLKLEDVLPPGLRVTLGLDLATAAQVLDELSRVSGLHFVYDPSLKSLPLRVELQDVALMDALSALGSAATLTYRVLDPKTIEVGLIFVAGTDGITNPKLVAESMVQPEYPREARIGRFEGHVIMQAVIDRHGAVRDLEVLRTSPDDFDGFPEAALEAVKQWRYEPATKDGVPVDVYFTVFVDFTLQ